MKKQLMAASLLISALTATVAIGGHRHSTHRDGFVDNARVTRVVPIYRTVTVSRPHRECREEVYRPVNYEDDNHHSDHGSLGIIIGGVIGGALGHNISRHSDSAKVAGAVIGSAVGHEVASKNSSRYHQNKRHYHRPQYEESCRTVQDRHTEKRLDGYRVSYRYGGETFTTVMDHNPGHRIKVRVKVSPID